MKVKLVAGTTPLDVENKINVAIDGKNPEDIIDIKYSVGVNSNNSTPLYSALIIFK